MKAWIESKGHGPVEMQTGKSGQFDVSIDGKPAYSRYETGRFPTEEDLQKIRFG